MPVLMPLPSVRQHAAGIFFSCDVTKREGVGRKQVGQRGVAGVGQNHIAGLAHLPGKIVVIFDEGVVRHPHRWMVGTQFVEEDVERGGFRSLFRQFFHETALNFARPVEAEMEADASVFHGDDARFLNGDEGEVGGGGRIKIQCGSRPKVIAHPFQPFKKPSRKLQTSARTARARKTGTGLSGLNFTTSD